MTPRTTAYKRLLECQKAPVTIYSLRRLLMMFTRFHWAATTNHGELEPMLGCFKYNLEEPEKGNLIVDLAARFNPDHQLDGIYVGLASAPLRRVAVGHLSEVTETGATRRYAWVRECNLRITHVFVDPDIGSLAAESTEAFIAGVMPPTMHYMNVHGWDMRGILEPRQMARTPKSLYGVDVSLQISFNWGVDVTPESHLLKEVISEVAIHQSP